MKIYIAHNFDARIALRNTIQLLADLGHTVTSTWITDDSHIKEKNDLNSAQVDLEDIDRADTLILFTDQFAEKAGKGKFMEFGYAIAKGKRVCIMGNDLNSSVFYALPQVTKLRTFEDLENFIMMGA